MKPLLEIRDVSLSYHTVSGETKALSNISFNLMPSEFLAVVGPSGCGKSTLLKNVTSDYHYHTVTAEEERILDDVEAELAKRGYLVEQKKEELQ